MVEEGRRNNSCKSTWIAQCNFKYETEKKLFVQVVVRRMTTEERVVRDKYNAETVLMDTYEDVRESNQKIDIFN